MKTTPDTVLGKHFPNYSDAGDSVKEFEDKEDTVEKDVYYIETAIAVESRDTDNTSKEDFG